jgi:hypothetical protein
MGRAIGSRLRIPSPCLSDPTSSRSCALLFPVFLPL